MKQFVIGFIVGVTFVSVAWAASRVTLVNGSSVEVGTTANPIYVQVI